MRNPHQIAGRDVYLHHYAENRIFMIRGQVLGNCLILIVAAILIAIASLLTSKYLTDDLKAEEFNKMEVWAEAMRSLNQADENTDINLVLKVLNGNNTIPVVVLGKNGDVQTSRIINDCKAISLIQHICYQKSSNTFDTDIFAEATLRGSIGKDAIASTKSLYDMVVLDSQGIEKSFAETLESEDDVVVYTKLPNGFYINTPMGKYNPDWAVTFREGSVKHVYFVAETKGNDIEESQIHGAEDAKIACARRHFAAISTGDVVYSVVKTYKDLFSAVTK